MKFENVNHISFDLDGTLIDSIPIMRKSWESAMSLAGTNIPFLSYAKYIGLPFDQIMVRLGLEDLKEEIQSEYFRVSKKNSGLVNLIPGVIDLFSLLREKGYTTSIITSKPRSSAQHIILSLELKVDCLICGDDFSVGKPHTEPGEALMKNFNLTPDQILYIGDMIFDFQFAHNCGFEFIFFENNGVNKLPRNLVNLIEKISQYSDLENFI